MQRKAQRTYLSNDDSQDKQTYQVPENLGQILDSGGSEADFQLMNIGHHLEGIVEASNVPVTSAQTFSTTLSRNEKSPMPYSYALRCPLTEHKKKLLSQHHNL